ncbi:MAG: hypothetical protein ACRDH8_01410 [Actinomycetota bacterium]
MAELVSGFVIGLLVGPVIRSWIAWREYAHASREARLHEDILRLMAGSRSPAEDPSRARNGGIETR